MATDRVERRMAAILAADMVAYSRLMEADEEGTLAALKALRDDLIEPKIAEYGGRIVKTTGDGMLVEFASVVEAVRNAVEFQRAMAERNADVPADRRIEFRVGINFGDIIIDGDDIYGDGVNIAARLEALAEPGGVCISGTAYEHLKTQVDVGYADLGEQQVKNIEKPVRAYRVLLDAGAAGTLITETRPSPRRWRIPAIAAALVIIVAAGGLAWWQPWVERVEAASLERMAFALPDKPSIAVLPFINIPNEIVSGEASWEPDERHRKTADQRVVAAMVKWSEGWDGSISDVEDLRKFTTEHVNQEKIALALRRLDKMVDDGSHGLTRIQPVLKSLAKELSYIEAQRETLHRIRRIGKILEHIRRIGGGQAGDTEEVTSVLRLFKLMMAALDEVLASVDDQVTEFLAAVSEPETLFAHIRQVRDELRYQLMAWEEPLPDWDTVNRKNIASFDVTSKIGDLYRFLAPRYAPTDEWVRIDQYKEDAAADDGANSEESAEQRSLGGMVW